MLMTLEDGILPVETTPFTMELPMTTALTLLAPLVELVATGLELLEFAGTSR
jgi:hypothetical protein